jgi:hypothetical protein
MNAKDYAERLDIASAQFNAEAAKAHPDMAKLKPLLGQLEHLAERTAQTSQDIYKAAQHEMELARWRG